MKRPLNLVTLVLISLLVFFVQFCFVLETEIVSLWSLESTVEKQGFHRELVREVNIDVDNRFHSLRCWVMLQESLPSGVYVDMYEMQNMLAFGGPKVLLNTTLDIEKPESQSTGFLAYVYPTLPRPIDVHMSVHVSLPIHLRYHAPSSDASYAVVSIPPPELYFHCAGKPDIKGDHRAPCDMHNTSLCHWTKVKQHKVALQFPDELLHDSCAVLRHLQKETGAALFILGDTSYGSCCVDEVAAQHYLADAIIHFGQSCLSSTNRLPVLNIFGKLDIEVEDCCTKLADVCEDRGVVGMLMYDVQYSHAADAVYEKLKETFPNLIFTTTTNTEYTDNQENEGPDHKPFKICNRFVRNHKPFNTESYTVLYIGSEGLTLNNMMMTLNKSQFYSYDPVTKTSRKETVNINKSLMKRYYKIEQAKDAKIIGIVIGTLGVSNYLEVINRLKLITKKAGKKSYMFSVGKLNVPKLANFMEVDVFVLVACPENTLLDSSEYYKPIVTPFEMEIACNPDREWTGEYVTDFGHLLPGGEKYVAMSDITDDRPDISLLSGQLRTMGVEEDVCTGGGEVMTRDEALTVAINQHNAAGFLSSRTFQGLEVDLGQTPVTTALQGQTGVAMGYTDIGAQGPANT